MAETHFKTTPPQGVKIRLGVEPPLLAGYPWLTIYAIQSSPCPSCHSTLWREVWSPGRSLWLCTGSQSCGSYWSPKAGARMAGAGEPFPTLADLEALPPSPLDGPEPGGPAEPQTRSRELDASETVGW